MTMPPWLRKLALALHITASIGWTSSVSAFLALVVVGLQSQNELRVRSMCLAIDITATSVIVMLSIASLSSGVMQLAVDAAAAIGALLVTTLLSIYKPRGLGWRKQREQRLSVQAVDTMVS